MASCGSFAIREFMLLSGRGDGGGGGGDEQRFPRMRSERCDLCVAVIRSMLEAVSVAG